MTKPDATRRKVARKPRSATKHAPRPTVESQTTGESDDARECGKRIAERLGRPDKSEFFEQASLWLAGKLNDLELEAQFEERALGIRIRYGTSPKDVRATRDRIAQLRALARERNANALKAAQQDMQFQSCLAT
jgi:hypothetical protein